MCVSLSVCPLLFLLLLLLLFLSMSLSLFFHFRGQKWQFEVADVRIQTLADRLRIPAAAPAEAAAGAD